MTPKEIDDLAKMVLRTIYDPEIPVDIYDLGLIYKIETDDDYIINIAMTLTSPNCPAAEALPNEVKSKLSLIPETKGVNIEITFDPPWDKSKMSEEAKFKLGFL